MKRKPVLYRDERGRFVSASVKIREALETMRGPKVPHEVVPAFDYSRIEYGPAVDAIYRPERKSVLRRAIDWLKWHPR